MAKVRNEGQETNKYWTKMSKKSIIFTAKVSLS
jgi:hypothetical protein